MEVIFKTVELNETGQLMHGTLSWDGIKHAANNRELVNLLSNQRIYLLVVAAA